MILPQNLALGAAQGQISEAISQNLDLGEKIRPGNFFLCIQIPDSQIGDPENRFLLYGAPPPNPHPFGGVPISGLLTRRAPPLPPFTPSFRAR